MEIIFATNNKHKVQEVQALVSEHIKILTLQEVGITEDLEEPFHTFEENANAKAQYVFNKTGINCMAEDSGLCVQALNGAPGVYSARYAGELSNDAKNNELLLKEMANISDRNAYYKSVIVMYLNGARFIFQGTCHGVINDVLEGENGFGYDPLFIPNGYSQTFASMPLSDKLKISHRTQAVSQLIEFLQNK